MLRSMIKITSRIKRALREKRKLKSFSNLSNFAGLVGRQPSCRQGASRGGSGIVASASSLLKLTSGLHANRSLPVSPTEVANRD